MSDLSLMVKAGVQWGLFGGAVENLGTERHHEAYVKKIINLELRGCFAMTETGHGSDVQALETTATYDADTEEFVIHSSTPNARKDYIGGAAETATIAAVFAQLDHHRGRRAGQPRRALLPGADPRRRRQRPAGRDHVGLPVQGRPARRRQRSHRVRPRSRSAGEPAEQIRRRGGRRHLHLADREPQPPVLHHDRHADPRAGDRRRQRGRRGPGGAGHRDSICLAAQAVHRTRRRRRSGDHGLPGASAPAVPADREVVRVAVRAERAGVQDATTCRPPTPPMPRSSASWSRGPPG